MKERIFNNWKTSMLGVIFLVFGGALVWTGRIPWEGFVGFIPFCLGLIYVKDTVLTANGSNENK